VDKIEIFKKVLDMVTPYCRNEAGLKNASESSRFLEDLGVNSARLVDIVLNMEDEFHIEIEDSVADKIHTLGDAVTLITQVTA
jgi:acyl carrier protein